MKEFKLKINFLEWYIKPEYSKDRRKIDIHFLCFHLDILKSKK